MDDIKNIKTLFKNNKGFELNQIFFKLETKPEPSIPDNLKKEFEMLEKKWKDKEKNNSFRNQDNLCITSFHMKDKKIFLNLCDVKYKTRQIFAEAISMLPDLDQEKILSDINDKKIKLPIAYKICIGVISKDDKLLFLKRSNKVSSNKNKIDFTLSKSAKPEDFQPRSSQPLLTILRAVKEELNINLDVKTVVKHDLVKISEFFLNKEMFSLGFFAILDLRKLESDHNADKIAEISESAKNSWEFSDLISIPFNKASIKKFLKDNKNKITNYSEYHLQMILESIS